MKSSLLYRFIVILYPGLVILGPVLFLNFTSINQ